MRSNTCPKCQGSMAEGFILDDGHGHSYHKPSSWIAGVPVKSLWTGLKLSGKQKLTVQTYRCGRCGFLESYATA